MSQPQPVQPISLRISVTDRCQHRCLYCMPPEGVPKCSHDDILSFEQITHFVRVAQSHFGISKVHITGGEPLVRTDIVELIGMLSQEGDFDLALTTNGHQLSNLAPQLKAAGLGRLNVSLDSLNADTFAKLTRGGDLQDTLEALSAALACGLTPVKLNTTVLRGVNDGETPALVRFAMDRGCEIRFLELMPIGPAQQQFDRWFVSSADVRTQLTREFTLTEQPRHAGISARRYLAEDRRGCRATVGFISSNTEPFCGDCRRLRLTASGRLVGCLAVGEGPDIRPALQLTSPENDHAIAEQIRHALCLKRTDGTFVTENLMSQTGG